MFKCPNKILEKLLDLKEIRKTEKEKKSRGFSAKRSSTSPPTTTAVSPWRASPFSAPQAPPWPRPRSLSRLCSRGAAEGRLQAVPRLESVATPPCRRRRRRAKFAQLAARRHAQLSPELLEDARTPFDVKTPRSPAPLPRICSPPCAMDTAVCAPSTIRRPCPI